MYWYRLYNDLLKAVFTLHKPRFQARPLTDLVSKAKLQDTEQRRDALIRVIGSKIQKRVNITSQRKKGHWKVMWILARKV